MPGIIGCGVRQPTDALLPHQGRDYRLVVGRCDPMP